MPDRGAARATARSRIDAPDADVLLAHVLGVEREALYAHPEVALTPDELGRFEALVERRARGEPVAYLRGFKEFYGLRLAVDPRVLIPRPETETLVEAVLAAVRNTPDALVVDVGTGSGAVAIALAVNAPALRVIATDVSSDALVVARANARTHDAAERIDFRVGDLLAPITERVDALAANLPYLRDDDLHELVGDRTSLAYEPALAVVAGPDGLSLIERAIAGLDRVLKPGASAFFECDPAQARALAREHGGTILRDLAGNERVVVISAGARGAPTASG
ncbi:MAG: peptide chain release factor N(5)-glutamine methyltransferase [Chloroflexi bacterium]|nr:peptide chain release factor N(5)-glutamine methyltransferase [Chloroflexota bacterium]